MLIQFQLQASRSRQAHTMAAAVAGGETGGERRHLDQKLLKALQRGDARTVERFYSQEVSMAIDHPDDDNVADQAGSWQGVTVGGNSALHIVADFGYLGLAELICAADSSHSLFLLGARNAAGETPLHCAARAGADRMISLFISVGGPLEAVLRAKDREGKTALYVAAREGHAAAARVLVEKDPELAAIVDNNGVSPLYAAALAESLEVVRILIASTQEASYAGPNGQTALHAAAIVTSSEIAEKLLQWKPALTKNADSSGSTPLHYLAATGDWYMMRRLLKRDNSPAYFSDSRGSCPIHVASRMGTLPIIRELIKCCPDMGELVDGRGRNFLHVAVEHKKVKIVRFICKRRLLRPLLVRIVNVRDCEGNTPLHLAVKSKNQFTVSLLLINQSVRPSIANKNGQTPLDLAIAGLDVGLHLALNPSVWIFRCLKGVGAVCGPRRLDQLVDEKITKLEPEKELKKYESTTQSLVIAAVLIATVTFAAAFTMPGGYKADDHQNGGTPTLAGKYAFQAFMIADFLAFVCSVVATILLMYAGSLTTDPSIRSRYIPRSTFFLTVAAHCMVAAFAMSVYVVLSTVSKPIAIFICVSSFASILFFASPHVWQLYRLAWVLQSRLGWWRMCKTRRIYCSIFSQVAVYALIYIFIFLVPHLLAIHHSRISH